MIKSKDYDFILTWLMQESNVDLIIPFVKELVDGTRKTDLKKEEIDDLRLRVMWIKENGHEKYVTLSINAE